MESRFEAGAYSAGQGDPECKGREFRRTIAGRVFERELAKLIRCTAEDRGVKDRYNEERPHSRLGYRTLHEFATAMTAAEAGSALLASPSSTAKPEGGVRWGARIHVGLETVDDLLEDLDMGLGDRDWGLGLEVSTPKPHPTPHPPSSAERVSENPATLQ